MADFIKLSKFILNMAYVSRISIKKDKFSINFIEKNFDGFFIFGSGGL